MKTQILSALGQKFTLTDGLLKIDYKKPLLTLKEGLENPLLAKARLEPALLRQDKSKNGFREAVFTQWSG